MQDYLLDLLYPRFCAICGSTVGMGRKYTCWSCCSDLSVITDPFCRVCGDPVDGMVEHSFECSWCIDRTPFFDLARSAVRFRGSVRKLIYDYKYSCCTHLTGDLVDMICAAVRAHYKSEHFDAVVPVPLHYSKARKRSYNQSALLARDTGKKLGIRYVSNSIQRVRPDLSQTTYNARQRKINVRGAFHFSMPQWIRGRNILVVDDVMTTGATVNEVSRELKRAGAARVCVVTAARG